MDLPDKKYNIIYADPPWYFNHGGVYQDNGRPYRKTSDKYPLMQTDDICNIPIKNITADDCILFLWTTDCHIPEALRVIDSWGFKFSTVAFYWVKKTSQNNNCYNVGCWTMKSLEICFLAIKGNPLKFKKKRNVKQLVESKRNEHSEKPAEVRTRIVELVGDLPRIELFARQRWDGWDCYGNELSDTIQRLIT